MSNVFCQIGADAMLSPRVSARKAIKLASSLHKYPSIMRDIVNTKCMHAIFILLFSVAVGCGKSGGVKIGKTQNKNGPAGSEKVSDVAKKNMTTMAEKLAPSLEKYPGEIGTDLMTVMESTLSAGPVFEEGKSVAGRITKLEIKVSDQQVITISMHSQQGDGSPWMTTSGALSSALQRIGTVGGKKDRNEMDRTARPEVAATTTTGDRTPRPPTTADTKHTKREIYAQCFADCKYILIFIAEGHWVVPLVHIRHRSPSAPSQLVKLKMGQKFLDKMSASGGADKLKTLQSPKSYDINYSVVPHGRSAFKFDIQGDGGAVLGGTEDLNISDESGKDLCLRIESAPNC